MAMSNTTKTVLIIGGGIAGLYILAKSGAFQKAQDALNGLLPSIGINLPIDLGSQLDLESLKDLLANIKQPGFNLPDLSKLLPGGSGTVTNPPEHATVTDVVYSMPGWAKGVIGVGATALGAYGGYQVIKASAPLLRAIGIQSARATGGVGNWLSRLFKGFKLPTLPGSGFPSYYSPIGPLLSLSFDPGAQAFFNRVLNAISLPTPLAHLAQEQGGTQATMASGGGAPIQIAPTWAMMEYGAQEAVRWGGAVQTAAEYARAIGVTPISAAEPSHAPGGIKALEKAKAKLASWTP